MSLSLFLALYCVEAGVFFLVVPWTKVWTLNPLLHNNPAIAMWADNPWVRGLISGFGVVHLLLGVRDLIRFARARRAGSGE